MFGSEVTEVKSATREPTKDRHDDPRGTPRERNVLVAGFEKAVQLFAPVDAEPMREEHIPAAGSLRCGFDFNWELECLASSTQPFSFSVTKKPVK